MKKIMILGASILQVPAIKKAKDMGLAVVAVDMNPEAVGFEIDAIEREIISTIDSEAVLEAAKRHKIDGIMTLASDMPMRTVAVVARELGLVGVSEDTAYKATNKAAMRKALRDSGVSVPMFFAVSEKEEFLQAVDKIRDRGYEVIAKPADNSGSRGVSLIDKFDIESLGGVFEYSKQFSRSGEILVEEYMTGGEVSVETLAVGGDIRIIQITDKLTTGAPYFVEMGHSQPTRFDKEIKDKICDVAIDANKAVGITNGPSHTEIKVTKEGPKVVEIGARLGGDCITTHLVPLSTGVDMVESCIKIALGEKPDFEKRFDKGSAIRFIKTKSGMVENITGLEEARQTEGIRQVSINRGIGEYVGSIKSSTDRAGFVIAQEDNAELAVKACESALGKIHYEINGDI